MMGSSIGDDENQFFDACENVVAGSDLSSASEIDDSWACGGSGFQVWMQNPGSVRERRCKFFDWLGLNGTENSSTEEPSCGSDSDPVVDRITSSDGAVLRALSFEHNFSSSRSSMSSSSGQERALHGEPSSCEDEFKCRVGNLDGGRDLTEDESEEDGIPGSIEPLKQTSLHPLQSGKRLEGRNRTDLNNTGSSIEGTKKWWLRKLRNFSCVIEEQEESESPDNVLGSRIQKVKVRHSGKHAKELSAVYLGQDIKAHEGSILTMKFSPDGQYLASAGEDGVIRIWKVVVDERLNEIDIPNTDSSCVYFTMNHLSEIKQLSCMEKDKMSKARRFRSTSDSACVVFPPKVFRLLDMPIYEFQGHCGEVLDLSWSNKNFLLSSSADKTVRLWQVGSNNCLRVFSHNTYVTSVQFNPVNDNYFISGSIDGKVRIWDIALSQVSSWACVKDIVSAVTYHPDGQGGVVGSMTGCCHFFNISDNQLQLEGQISLYSKKKSSGKRVTTFQYFLHDPSKVMITCADSQVRILQGMNIVGKYKGLRKGGNYISASFTADGKHIISACEDSNVYMWNVINQEREDPSYSRSFCSYERFQSSSSSVAIPWSGLQSGDLSASPFSLTSLSHFPRGQEFFFESHYNTKGCHQTWPEENLPPASSHQGPISTLTRSEYKFLRACHESVNGSNVWGLVIVTGGWDGRIKSYHNYGLPRPH